MQSQIKHLIRLLSIATSEGATWCLTAMDRTPDYSLIRGGVVPVGMLLAFLSLTGYHVSMSLT